MLIFKNLQRKVCHRFQRFQRFHRSTSNPGQIYRTTLALMLLLLFILVFTTSQKQLGNTHTKFKRSIYPVTGPIKMDELNPQVRKQFLSNGLSHWVGIKQKRDNTLFLEKQIPSQALPFKNEIQDHIWSAELIEKLVDAEIANVDISPEVYPGSALQIFKALHKLPPSPKTKRVLIAGAISPWVEAIVAAFPHASWTEIITTDYNAINIEPNRHNIKFLEMDMVQPVSYDVVISFSSIEHDGLGRYGDPMNPNGDIEAVKEYHSFLKPHTGVFMFAVPTTKNAGYIFGNMHRVYSPERINILQQAGPFTQLGVINPEEVIDTDKILDWQYQPVFIWQC